MSDEVAWHNDTGEFEIRTEGTLPDGRPALDEIVCSGAFVHLEQMNPDQWWMGIEAGGKYFNFTFGIDEGHLRVRLSDHNDEGRTCDGASEELAG